MTDYILWAEPGIYRYSGQPVELRVLRDLALDSGGPFYSLVLTYLVASAGLTPVYDAKNYPTFMKGIAGVFPGAVNGDLRANLAECVGLARAGTPQQRIAEVSLCCMLANTAYESIPAQHRKQLSGNSVFEVFRHVRNAASHGNAWHFRDSEPTARGEWHQIVVDEARKGDKNPLQAQACIYGTLQPADLLYLLRDVENLLRGHAASPKIFP
jgi:hypothetical protein